MNRSDEQKKKNEGEKAQNRFGNRRWHGGGYRRNTHLFCLESRVLAETMLQPFFMVYVVIPLPFHLRSFVMLS